MACAGRSGMPVCPSAQRLMCGPSLSRKKVLRKVRPRNTISDDSFLRPCPTPWRSAGTASPTALETSSRACSAVSRAIPASAAHPAIVSLAERSSPRISSAWLVIPPRTIAATSTASSRKTSNRRAAAAPRPTLPRSSLRTSGDAPAAIPAAVMTGVTIVLVSERTQTSPTTASVTPTASHAVNPRSRSHLGAANRPTSSRGSSSTSPESCGASPGLRIHARIATLGRSRRPGRGAAQAFLRRGERPALQLVVLGPVDRARVEQALRVCDLGGRAVSARHLADVAVDGGLLRLEVAGPPLRHLVVLCDQVDQHPGERQHDEEDRP